MMLSLSHVSKTFNPGSVNERLALNNVSLDLEKGDFVSIIGSNGAGKSTLLNAISGVFLVDEGRIVLDGTDITDMAEYKRSRIIGRLFQNPALGTAPDMSIEENLFLASGRGGWITGISAADRREFKERLALLNMGLEDRLKSPVGTLSGGQRQALTLLMATYNPPKLLLLDEHTAALDPKTSDKVLELTEKVVSENNITCLMITHNMQTALDLGNRTLMMNAGEIVYDVQGEERSKLEVQDLLRLFREKVGGELNNDRMLMKQQ